MSDSRRALRAFADFYKIETRDMLVAHDEIDFEVAKTRLKRGGGHGGHNGLVDVIRHLGADFWRLRVQRVSGRRHQETRSMWFSARRSAEKPCSLAGHALKPLLIKA